MKTINEAASDYAEETKDTTNGMFYADSQDAFKAWVEFAQRWISVEEELPNRYYIPVIVKDSGGNWDKAVYSGLSWKFANENTDVGKITHWKPIESK